MVAPLWAGILFGEGLWGTKYKEMRGHWHSVEVTGAHGVCMWKHVRGGWERFLKHTRFLLRMEWDFFFLLLNLFMIFGVMILIKKKNIWCDDMPLKSFFPQCNFHCGE